MLLNIGDGRVGRRKRLPHPKHTKAVASSGIVGAGRGFQTQNGAALFLLFLAVLSLSRLLA